MIRYSIATIALFTASAALAQQAPSGNRSDDIVVTGQGLDQTGRALKECIARHCPVDEDVAATLQHAENQFVAGDYKDARGTLLASLGRNKDGAKQFPVLVASLYRANGRIAAHLGEGESYRISTIDSIDALKAGLDDDDPRVIAQRVEIGDMFANIGRTDAALDLYGKAVKQAHDSNLPQIEGPARLRIANLKVRIAGETPLSSNSTRAAIGALDMIVDDRDPSMDPYRFVAKVMKARLFARRGDTAPFDALIAELRARPFMKTPVLLDAKPIDLNDTTQLRKTLDKDSLLSQSLTADIPSGAFDDQWIDVSFFIKPDGTVSDAEVIRESKDQIGPWSNAVMASVKSRHYAPLSLAPSDPGLLRVERYTYTAMIQDMITGSRLRTRSTTPRIEVLDLTREAASTKS